MKTSELKHGDDAVTVKTEIRDGILRAEVGDRSYEGKLLKTGPGAGLWKTNSTAYRMVAVKREGKIWAAVNGRVYLFDDVRAQDELGVAGDAENSVAAPMPGKVIKVLVSEGDSVEEGQPVLIVEAMKMEHTLKAPTSGKVTRIDCADGDSVGAGVPLVQIEES